MKKIGIVANREKDTELHYTRILANKIIKSGGEIKICANIANELGFEGGEIDEEAVYSQAEVIICLGGDGTFLKAARSAYKKDTPILGINLGSLGFLTEVDRNDIEDAVDNVLNNNFDIQKRMMLETVIRRNNEVIASDTALNDIIISRGALSRILHVKTYINNTFMDSIPGDGVVVSSPTGSTAYSLSAGGPIVEPDVELIIITPICPHTMYSRSCVTTAGRIVRLVIDENYAHNAMVTVDGQIGYQIRGGDSIEVRKSQNTVKVITLNSRNFFNILRTKIYNRGECLRKDEI